MIQSSPRSRLSANYYLAPAGYGVADFMKEAKRAGAAAVGLTIAALESNDADGLARLADEHGLHISSLNSAGYFLFSDAARREQQRALNSRLIEAAARMGAGRLVVIAGGILGSGLALEPARVRVAEQLAALDAEAGAANVRLALEPIHPADLTGKGCVNSIRQALDMIRHLHHTDFLIDVFHSFWDPDIWSGPVLSDPKLALVQVCDWYEPSPEEKPQRTLPGHGHMDMSGWLAALEKHGFRGPIEFEMFDRHRGGRAVGEILTEALGYLRAALGSE
jgi:sugar phosphate isomerase/epimerase